MGDPCEDSVEAGLLDRLDVSPQLLVDGVVVDPLGDRASAGRKPDPSDVFAAARRLSVSATATHGRTDALRRSCLSASPERGAFWCANEKRCFSCTPGGVQRATAYAA